MKKPFTIRIGASNNEVTIGTKTYDLGIKDRAELARLRAFIVREWKRNRQQPGA